MSSVFFPQGFSKRFLPAVGKGESDRGEHGKMEGGAETRGKGMAFHLHTHVWPHGMSFLGPFQLHQPKH